VAYRDRLVPPAFGPGTHTARRPNVGILVQAIVSRARHRAETMRDQVDGFFENRKFSAIFEKVVGHGSLEGNLSRWCQNPDMSRVGIATGSRCTCEARAAVLFSIQLTLDPVATARGSDTAKV